MSIKSQENVNILIGVLSSEYPDMKKDKQFINHFYSQIENIYNNRYSIGNLQQQNKILLSTCMKFYNKNKPIVLKKKSNKQTSSFNDYENSYNKLLNPNKPKDIDFSDTILDEPISNIDNIMNQTLEDREKELYKITNQYNGTNTKNWLKSTETRETPKIKILDDKSEQKKERRVRFEIQEKNEPDIEDDISNLLNKLKKKGETIEKNETNTNILEKLDEIKNNQLKMLSLIEKLIESK
tara:strand:- start:11235 stop:11951 length:717 start_codon:yes stop_codon:yes gene_type:complete